MGRSRQRIRIQIQTPEVIPPKGGPGRLKRRLLYYSSNLNRHSIVLVPVLVPPPQVATQHRVQQNWERA